MNETPAVHLHRLISGQSKLISYKGSKSKLIMLNKTVLAAAIIATTLATLSVAASEMANASKGELALKLMAFISLIIFDVYALVAILKENNKD